MANLTHIISDIIYEIFLGCGISRAVLKSVEYRKWLLQRIFFYDMIYILYNGP